MMGSLLNKKRWSKRRWSKRRWRKRRSKKKMPSAEDQGLEYQYPEA
jgi:hypothetical protein